MQRRLDARGERRLPRDDPRPGQRHVLPGPGVLLLIAAKAGERRRDRAGLARRPEAHVNLVKPALGGGRRQGVDQALGKAGEVVARRERLGAVAGVEALIAIVDEDQVQIGAHRHLAAAQLAEAEDRQLGAGQAAVGLGEFLQDRLGERGDDAIGDVAQRPAGLGQGVGVAQDLHADLELAVVGPAPRQVEHVLEVPSPREPPRQLLVHGRAARRPGVEVGRQDGIQQARVAAQVIGESRRRAHDLGQQVEQVRVGVQQGEQLHPGGQAGEELVELDQGGVRVGRAAQGLEQGRHQLGQELAGPGAARRAVAAVVPAAHQAEDPLAVGEAELL